MGVRPFTRHVVVVVAFALLVVAATATSAASADRLRDGQAWFEGEVIDLSQDWGEARACLVWRDADTVECFRTAQEMEQATSALQRGVDSESAYSREAAQCSSWLYLYDYTNSGGRTLQFRDRGYWQNLSSWGFSNNTSSFRTGACSVALADWSGGGGSHYPGTTSAYHYAPTMVTGWNNRVSSIYVY